MNASQTNQQNISNAQGKRKVQSFGIYKFTHWLATDVFCLSWVSKALYVSRNKSHCKNLDKKAWQTQGFDFLSVRKKVRPSAGLFESFRHFILVQYFKYIQWMSDKAWCKNTNQRYVIKSSKHDEKHHLLSIPIPNSTEVHQCRVGALYGFPQASVKVG